MLVKLCDRDPRAGLDPWRFAIRPSAGNVHRVTKNFALKRHDALCGLVHVIHRYVSQPMGGNSLENRPRKLIEAGYVLLSILE